MKLFLLATFVLFFNSFAMAQDTPQIRLLFPYSSDTNAIIKGKDKNNKDAFVKIMGIQPFSKNQKTYGIFINTLIQDKTVTCKIFDQSQRPIIGQCLNHQEQDIALSLIENGIALVNRDTLENKNLKNIYLEAETTAKQYALGEWSTITNTTANRSHNDNEALFEGASLYMILIALMAGPLAGMLIVSFIMYGGFNRLIKLQKYQIASAQQRDRSMREREKFIVAASLEGEINTNRAKLDAFILIYEELLKNLRDPLKEPKYKKSGDIIHEAPALSRHVFDSNMDKMDLLGPSIVTDLTKLYIEIEPTPKYKTFEPDTPIEDVVEFIATIIRNAENMIEPINQIAGALNIIVRNKK
jgi:hypothetical protein